MQFFFKELILILQLLRIGQIVQTYKSTAAANLEISKILKKKNPMTHKDTHTNF